MIFRYQTSQLDDHYQTTRLDFDEGVPFNVAIFEVPIVPRTKYKIKLQIIKYFVKNEQSKVISQFHYKYQYHHCYQISQYFVQKIIPRSQRQAIVDFFMDNMHKFNFSDESKLRFLGYNQEFQLLHAFTLEPFTTLFNAVAAFKLAKSIISGNKQLVLSIAKDIWKNEGRFLFKINLGDIQNIVVAKNRIDQMCKNIFYSSVNTHIFENSSFQKCRWSLDRQDFVYYLNQVTFQVFRLSSEIKNGEKCFIHCKKGIGKHISFDLLKAFDRQLDELRTLFQPNQYRQYFDSEVNWDQVQHFPKYIYARIDQYKGFKLNLWQKIKQNLPLELKIRNINDEQVVSEIHKYYAQKNIAVIYIIDNIDNYYQSFQYQEYNGYTNIFSLFQNETVIYVSAFQLQCELHQMLPKDFFNPLKQIGSCKQIKQYNRLRDNIQMTELLIIQRYKRKHKYISHELIPLKQQQFKYFRELISTDRQERQYYNFLSQINYATIRTFVVFQDQIIFPFKYQYGDNAEKDYWLLFRSSFSKLYQYHLSCSLQKKRIYDQKQSYLDELMKLAAAAQTVQNKNTPYFVCSLGNNISSEKQTKAFIKVGMTSKELQVVGDKIIVHASPLTIIRIANKISIFQENSYFRSYFGKQFKTTNDNLQWFGKTIKRFYIGLFSDYRLRFELQQGFYVKSQINKSASVQSFTKMLKLSSTRFEIALETSIYLRFCNIFCQFQMLAKQKSYILNHLILWASISEQNIKKLDPNDSEDNQIIDFILIKCIQSGSILEKNRYSNKQQQNNRQRWEHSKKSKYIIKTFEFCISFDSKVIAKKAERASQFFKRFRRIEQLENTFEGGQRVNELVEQNQRMMGRFIKMEDRDRIYKMKERYEFGCIEHTIIVPQVMKQRRLQIPSADHLLKMQVKALEDIEIQWDCTYTRNKYSTSVDKQLDLCERLLRHLRQASIKFATSQKCRQ